MQIGFAVLKAKYLCISGNVPGPLIFGLIFDNSCLVWQDKCGEEASCWIYDSDYLAQGLTIIVVIVAFIALAMFFLGAITYRPPPETDETADYVIGFNSENEANGELTPSEKPPKEKDVGGMMSYDNVGFTPDSVGEKTDTVDDDEAMTRI